MNEQQKQAVQTLVAAVDVAMKSGAFGIQDAGMIIQAIGVLSTEAKQAPEKDPIEKQMPIPKKGVK